MAISRIFRIPHKVVIAMCLVPAVFIQAGELPNKDRRDISQLEPKEIFPPLMKFVQNPETKPDTKFVRLRSDGKPNARFETMPKGWFTWKDTDPNGRMIVLDEDGFRLIVEVEAIPRVPEERVGDIRAHNSVVLFDNLFVPKVEQIPRLVTFYQLRSARKFSECRYVPIRGGGTLRVELSIISGLDGSKSLDQLLTHLRKHYGKYQGICEQAIQLGMN